MYQDIIYPEIISGDKNSLIKEAYLFSCRKDVEALKPGNVYLSSPHADTNSNDYIKSSIHSSEVLFLENFELGERILESIKLTKKFIKQNTNLGIILVCAPLIHSLIKYHDHPLKEGLLLTLQNSTKEDTLSICEAINIANPGGLGKSREYDTQSLPNVGLVDIMEYSSKYDRISYQYTHSFKDILDFVVPCLNHHQERYKSLDFSISLTFLEILSKIPDSHIERKFGHKIAKKTSNQANDLLKILVTERINQDSFYNQLNNLDYAYKKQGINPGTTADLLVAGLMIKKIFKGT
tara:strand:- start:495 stop:1376 length:882 start_codon:yes stop_codon:yes gene_type:complete